MTLASPQLFPALEGIGQRPALVWYGEDGRTELSGHVLANWVTKSANHLGEEVMAAPGDTIVLDLPPHWKRTVLALAAWSLGLDVVVRGADGIPEAPGILATDDPDTELAGSADELLVLEAAALSLRFPAALPPLARDWAQEVRGSGDQLTAELGPWSGPQPAQNAAAADRSLIDDDAVTSAATALGAWLVGGSVVGPSARIDAGTARAEGVSA